MLQPKAHTRLKQALTQCVNGEDILEDALAMEERWVLGWHGDVAFIAIGQRRRNQCASRGPQLKGKASDGAP